MQLQALATSVSTIDPLVGDKVGEEVTFYSTGPDHTENKFQEDLIQDIEKATESIHVQHMHFHPTPELLEAMQGAAKRVVKISIATNRSGKDMPLTHDLFVDMSRMNWKLLLGGQENPNVRVFIANSL